MTRLVIIVTFDKNILWKKVENWDKPEVGSIEMRFKQFNNDLVVVFCHPSGYESEQRQKTTEMVKNLLNTEPYNKFNEVYIAAHQGRVNWQHVRGQVGDRMKGSADFVHYGEEGSKGQDEVYDAILNLVNNPSPDTLNELIEAIKKKPLIHRLSILKHKIAHLFLSIDIDLQKLVETGFDDEYLEEVFENWENKASGKLDEVKRLVYEMKQEQGKSVIEIIESGLKDEDKKIICKLKAILPEKEGAIDGSEEELKELRELYNEVKEILECLNNKNNKEKLKKIYRKGGNPFKKWFNKLCNILDEIMVKLK